MTYSFNLIERNWIPCISLDGNRRELGIHQVLSEAHDLRAIQGDSPLETAAIYRLLLAVLHSALRGPSNRLAWSEIWEEGSFFLTWLEPYLVRYQHRFDLFHPQTPFYQWPDDRVQPKSITSLVLDMASGNNGLLFDHHSDLTGATLTAPQAARALVVAQSYSLGGLSGLKQPFTDGPWGRGIVYLVEGDTVFETLALNLMRYPDEAVFASQTGDCPAWEQDNPHEPPRQVPAGYLDYLTWQNRCVRLIPEGSDDNPVVRSMTVAPGLRLDSAVRDPFKLYRTGATEGLLVNRFSEDRALWRDSGSLFSLSGTRGSFPPKNFDWLTNLAENSLIPRDRVYRFIALGMANDKAKVEFFQEQHMPLQLAYLQDDALVEKLSDALKKAENACFSLKIASQWLALLVSSPKEDGKQWREVSEISRRQAEGLAAHWNYDRIYWQQLELPFYTLLEDLPESEQALNPWEDSIRSACWESLDKVIEFAGTGSPALKAAVRARSIMGGMLHQLFAQNQTEQT